MSGEARLPIKGRKETTANQRRTKENKTAWKQRKASEAPEKQERKRENNRKAAASASVPSTKHLYQDQEVTLTT